MGFRANSLRSTSAAFPRAPRALGLVAATVVLGLSGVASAQIPASWLDGSATGYVTPNWERDNCPPNATAKAGLGQVSGYTGVGSYANPKAFVADDVNAARVARNTANALTNTQNASANLTKRTLNDTNTRLNAEAVEWNKTHSDKKKADHPIDASPDLPVDLITDLPTTLPPRTRKAVHSLTAVERTVLKEAFALVQALPSTDPRSIVILAATHCLYCSENPGRAPVKLRPGDLPATGDIHFGGPMGAGGVYFLPFHRGLLYQVERIMRKLLADAHPNHEENALRATRAAAARLDSDSGKIAAVAAAKTATTLSNARRDFALPYWDWRRPIDDIYLAADTGATSLPNQGSRPVTQMTTVVNFGTAWAALMRQPANAFFGTMVPGSSSHINPHNEAGGWMWNPLHSARQPLFYGHHGNLDRMMAEWRAARLVDVATNAANKIWNRVGSNTPKRREDFPEATAPSGAAATPWRTVYMKFPDADGTWVQLTAADVADAATLGYTYAAP